MMIAGLIILVLVFIAGIILADDYPQIIATYFIVLLGVLFFAIGVDDGSYKDGQIDAINGIIKYELQEQEDKSVKWVEIEED